MLGKAARVDGRTKPDKGVRRSLQVVVKQRKTLPACGAAMRAKREGFAGCWADPGSPWLRGEVPELGSLSARSAI